MEEPESIECPFCGYQADGDYQIMLHMETLHPEGGESPFIAKDDASVAAIAAPDEERIKNDNYINCPVEGCGEALLLTELESHVEMHEEEQDSTGDESSNRSKRIKLDLKPGPGATFDTKLSYALRNLDDLDEPRTEQHRRLEEHRESYVREHDRENERRLKTPPFEKGSSESRLAIAKAAWKELLRIPDPKQPSSTSNGARRRLGKSELGPHAHEKQMPSWLVKLLEDDGASKTVTRLDRDGNLRKVKICPNMTAGIVPVLQQLLEQDEKSEYSYLCHPAVKHVSKLKREGGFCGYRNIQMMSSYIVGTFSQGHEVFKGKIPTIFKIQDWIESAWDMGIHAQGRIETGGIRGTRKYIGTPDAQAMLISLGISCDAEALKLKGDEKPTYELLFENVENYFMNGCRDYNPKVRCTSLPSIYFQRPGHSMTIVGFERKVDGSRNLIVFDPMYHDAPNVVKRIGERFRHRDPEDLLRAYRRGAKYLKRYNEFELLKLTPPTPAPSLSLHPIPPRVSSLPTHSPPLSTAAHFSQDTGGFGA